MRQASWLLVAALAVAVAAAAVAAASFCGLARAFSAPEPSAPPEATRVHRVAVNLDGDARREVVYVYNVDARGMPQTGFAVWDHRGRAWSMVQAVLVSTSPGALDSGLKSAWVHDLNRDGRVEIATRDFLTPSAGEVLSVYRQRSSRSLRFAPLQRIAGDAVEVALVKPNTPAEVHVQIKSNHSADGRAHAEIWRWSGTAGRWTCRVDCMARTTSLASASIYKTAQAAAASFLRSATFRSFYETKLLRLTRRPLLASDVKSGRYDPKRVRLYLVQFLVTRVKQPAVLGVGKQARFAYVKRAGTGWKLLGVGSGP